MGMGSGTCEIIPEYFFGFVLASSTVMLDGFSSRWLLKMADIFSMARARLDVFCSEVSLRSLRLVFLQYWILGFGGARLALYSRPGHTGRH